MLESVAQVVTILGVFGLLFAYRSLRSSLNTFHHEVITNCACRFQKLSPKLSKRKPKDKSIREYIGLCNEEIFYFEQGYLPQAVVDEWVEGMLGYLGLWRGSELLFLSSRLSNLPTPDTDAWRLATRMRQEATSFPRFCHAFTMDTDAQKWIAQVKAQVQDATLTPEEMKEADADVMRAQMVLEVLANLRAYEQQPFYKHLRRKRAEYE